MREEAAAEEGVPLAVKDLFDTAGLRTTYGSAIFGDHVPTETAEAVRRLETDGYVTVGKTNLHEFAYGISSENVHYGDAVNPAFPGRIPGGSSGGSAAALVAGMADAALGTDSGGSIRIPAACCGIVGFKPTFGLVSTDGVFPLTPSFDHAGPMARTVAECAEIAAVLVPELDPHALGSLEEVELGIAWLDEADPLVRRRVEGTAALFPRRRRLDFPLDHGSGPAFMREAIDVHRELFAEHRDRYGPNIRTKLDRCLAVTDEEDAAARAAREAYRVDSEEALDGVDLLAVPTLAFVAPSTGLDELELRHHVTRLTLPFNALGWPALALPCGAAEDGLPASLSLVGRPGADALVLAAGLALEDIRSPV